MKLATTASQTVGPYFAIGLTGLEVHDLVGPGVSGERVTIQGRVIDGDGVPVNDAVVEIWQANSHGKYAHPDDTQEKLLEENFKGFGRVATDAKGGFRLDTIKPGRVPGPGGTLQAPHIAVSLFMRGILKQLVTRIYFPDEPSNAEDPVLKLVDADRRSTLIAKKTGPGTLEWNIILQGEQETVFFDW